MNNVKPISPHEVLGLKKNDIPDVVFEVFNLLIARAWDGRNATINQKMIIRELEAREVNINDVFAKHWLDVEDIYRDRGWVVEYDKPGYNESGDSYFRFRIKR